MSDILIVENDQKVINILQQILARNGFTTTGTLDGNKAIELCHQNPNFELVMIDFALKEISADSLIKDIFQLRPYIKMIITAETGDDPNLDAWLKKPNTYFLKKPYDTKDLTKLIRDMAQSW